MLSPQNRPLFKLNTVAKAPDEDLMLENFSWTEGLSRLFHMDFTLLGQRADVKLKALIGRAATVKIETRRWFYTLYISIRLATEEVMVG